MLSENVGFDVCELQFEQFVGESTLYHVVLGTKVGLSGANPSESLKGDEHCFEMLEDALTFIEHSDKDVVCISSIQTTSLVATKKNLHLLTVEGDSYVTKSGHRLSGQWFPTNTHLFGFYEWLNIVANQKPSDIQQQLIIEAFQAYLQHRYPAEEARGYLNTLQQAFSQDTTGVDRKLLSAIQDFSSSIRKLRRKALIVVDVQNDFCEGGSLAVPNSNAIFGPINELKRKINFQTVVLTKDMHPQTHVSFASTHKMNPFVTIDINGLPQELWPDHCVRGTEGADISSLLEIDGKYIIVEKGVLAEEDAYSGFGKKEHPTELLTLLKQHRIQEVVVVGLALDFCVGSTAFDAKEHGFETYVVLDATRAVMSHTEQVTLGKLEERQIHSISLEEAIRLLA